MSGVVLVVLASAAAFADVQLRGGVGDRTWTPRTVGRRCTTQYRLGVGESTLDLSELDLGSTDRQRVEIRQGVGHLLMVVPADVTVLVDADVRAGEIRCGRGRRPRRPAESGRHRPVGAVHRAGRIADRRPATLVIDAELGLGSLEVRRATS